MRRPTPVLSRPVARAPAAWIPTLAVCCGGIQTPASAVPHAWGGARSGAFLRRPARSSTRRSSCLPAGWILGRAGRSGGRSVGRLGQRDSLTILEPPARGRITKRERVESSGSTYLLTYPARSSWRRRVARVLSILRPRVLSNPRTFAQKLSLQIAEPDARDEHATCARDAP